MVLGGGLGVLVVVLGDDLDGRVKMGGGWTWVGGLTGNSTDLLLNLTPTQHWNR